MISTLQSYTISSFFAGFPIDVRTLKTSQEPQTKAMRFQVLEICLKMVRFLKKASDSTELVDTSDDDDCYSEDSDDEGGWIPADKQGAYINWELSDKQDAYTNAVMEPLYKRVPKLLFRPPEEERKDHSGQII